MWGIALLLVLAAHSAQGCDDQAATVAAHNKVRREYGAGPLQWDDGLADIARAWARNLASKGCQLQHSRRPGYGENIAATWGGYVAGCATATVWWADEAMLYKWGPNPWTLNGKNFASIGHFTQVVWASTKRVGCGAATGSNGCWVAVCNYQEPGNYATDDQFLANVRPKNSAVLGGGSGTGGRSAKPPPPKSKPKSPPPKPVKPKSPPPKVVKPKSPPPKPVKPKSPPPKPVVRRRSPPPKPVVRRRSPPPKPVVRRSPPKYTPRSCSEASWCSWFKNTCNLNVMKQLCPRTCNGCRRRLIEQPVATSTQPQQLFRRVLQTGVTTEPLVVKEVAATAQQQEQEQAKFLLARPVLQVSA